MILENYDMSYELYLFKSAIEEAKLFAHTKECILIATNENTFQNMKSIHEGVAESLKNAYQKIIDLFAKMWAKFIEQTKSLFNSNVKFLNDYKDIILKKPAKEGNKWIMYNWQDGQKAMLSTAIPNFNYTSMKDNMGDNSTFSKKYFMHLCPADVKEDINIEQLALKKFRGGWDEEQEILESKMNMTDMFNYCIKYNTIIDNLKKDVSNVQKASKECENKINQANQEGKMQPKPAEQSNSSAQSSQPQNNTNNTPKELPKKKFDFNEKINGKSKYTKNAQTKEVSEWNGKEYKPTGFQAMGESYEDLFDDKYYRSIVYEGVVLEFGPSKDNSTATTGGDSNDPSKSMQKFDKSRNSGDTGNATDYDDIVKRIGVYNECCCKVATAKMATAETMYKQYMAIIKAKVSFYAGDKKTADTGAAASTNQNVKANQKEANTGTDVSGTANQLNV